MRFYNLILAASLALGWMSHTQAASVSSGPSRTKNVSAAGETEEEKKKRCIQANVDAYAACCATVNNCADAKDEQVCNRKGNNAEAACLAGTSVSAQAIENLKMNRLKELNSRVQSGSQSQ